VSCQKSRRALRRMGSRKAVTVADVARFAEPEAGGRLILLCGVAGAGKTTFAKRLEADGAVRMCPDEWLIPLGFDIYDREGRLAVADLQWELTRSLVTRGVTVVDESGMWQRAERDHRRSWPASTESRLSCTSSTRPLPNSSSESRSGTAVLLLAKRTSSQRWSSSGAIASNDQTWTNSPSSTLPRSRGRIEPRRESTAGRWTEASRTRCHRTPD